MSLNAPRDITLIQDEDVLRKMWQDTEDFGRKKEIRTHMYKLREARLRDFYSSSEVGNDLHRAPNHNRNNDKPNHADSLADHSFLSLKSKEIRDSESPTRDMSYKVAVEKHNDHGWNIVTSQETSGDGKSHTTTRVASTAGSHNIDGGKIDYAAKNEEKASVYRDGDDKNFTKSVGAEQHSVIKQEAVGGDENNSFRSSSTKTSSSSRVVTEHKSSSGDATDNLKALPSNIDQTIVRRQIYNDDIPNEVKSHPSYVEGKTKVYRETKTLADGSTVTTTRYETLGSNTSQQTNKNQHYTTSTSSNVHQSSTNVQKNQQATNVKQISNKTVSGQDYDKIPDNRNQPSYVDDNTRVFKETKTLPDGSTVTTTRYENVGSTTNQHSTNKQYSTHTSNVEQQRSTNINQVNQKYVDDNVKYKTNVTKHIENIPVDNRNQPAYVDDNTRVYKETKTLPDGSTVTTTRYETVGSTSNQQTTNKKHSTHTSNVYQQHLTNTNQENQKYIDENVRSTTVKNKQIDNVPVGRNNQPTYVDDNTRVYKETKTLPDGSTVTTTRYETIGTTNQQKSTTSTNNVHNQKSTKVNQVNQKFVDENVKQIVSRPASDTPTDNRVEPQYIDGNTKVFKETKTLPDGTTVTTTRYETTGTAATHSTKNDKYSTTNTSSKQQKSVVQQSTTQTNKTVKDTNEHATKQIEYVDNYKPSQEITVKIIRENAPREQQIPIDKKEIYTTTKTTTIYNEEPTIHTRKVLNKRNESITDVNEFINVEKQHEKDTRVIKITKEPSPDRSRPREQSPVKQIPPQREPKESPSYETAESPIKQIPIQKEPNETPLYEIPDRRQPFKPQKPEFEPSYDYKEPQGTPIYQTPDRRQPIKPGKSEFEPSYGYKEPQDRTVNQTPERTRPIKPGKSDLDKKPEPTQGQYDTTYRTEYTPKRISVDVSPTHDAFARSLRAVSPDRISNRGSVRSLRTSTSSLRSTTSPEKNRHPTRYSPDRKPNDRSTSPRKSTDRFSSTETITYKTSRLSPDKKSPKLPEYIPDKTTKKPTDIYNTDTITKRKVTNGHIPLEREIDSNTLTRKKNKPKDRSPSPTSTASDIEYIRTTNEETTDLDEYENTIKVTKKNIRNNYEDTTKDVRPTSLEITTKKTRRITDRSPTSPLTDLISPKRSPVKEVPRRSSLKSPVKEPQSPSERPPKYFTVSPTEPKRKEIPTDRPLKRTDTYEERCRQILGITETTTERRRSSLERLGIKRDSLTKTKPLLSDTPKRASKSPEKTPKIPTKSPVKELEQTPLRRSPSKSSDYPSPTRKSPEKSPMGSYPQKKSSLKDSPKISEFPSQVRKSPIKEPIGKYPEKKTPTKQSPKISEFPAQIRRSPEKEPLGEYPEKKRPTKNSPSVTEFPSQIRRSPEREPLGDYPEKRRPTKDGSSVAEFPSQIRKSPEREPLGDYPEKRRPSKDSPSIAEFPSQIRRSPEKEPLGEYPEKRRPTKDSPSVAEFPSQIRRSPEREPLGDYPDKRSLSKDSPSIAEFPSQIRRSPEKEPLGEYPEKRRPTKDSPSVAEFPSQIRRSPEKEPLGDYPEKRRPSKGTPSIAEFPSQIRRSPEREPLGEYPEKRRPTKDSASVAEFPSQIRRSPEKEPLGEYPEKRRPSKDSPSIAEFPSQIRRSPEREPLGEYPEKRRPTKDSPSVAEFPSQIRRSPGKEPLGEYPEKRRPTKDSPSIAEFPSQIRRSPEREPLGEYPEKRRPTKDSPSVAEFPSQIRRSPEREPLGDYPEKRRPTKDSPSVAEFPSQIRRTPEKEPLEKYPEKKRPTKNSPNVSEFPSQVRRSPERKPFGTYPEKPKSTKTTEEFIIEESRVRHEEESIDNYPDERSERPKKPTEYPSQFKKSPDQVNKYPTENKKIRPTDKQTPKKKTKDHDDNTSSSSSEEDTEVEVTEVEEISTVKKYIPSETERPIEEPLVTERFISQLCREDEVTKETKRTTKTARTDIESLIEQEIIANETRPNKTLKKNIPEKSKARKPTEKFINNEKTYTEIIDAETVTNRSPIRKPSDKTAPTKKTEIKTTKTVKKDLPTTISTTTTRVIRKPIPTKSDKPRFGGLTEYTDEYGRPKPKDSKKVPQKQTQKTTLWDVENITDTEEDTRVHVRTHRIDDTITKRTRVVNGDINKKTTQLVGKRPVSGFPKDDVNKSSIIRKPEDIKPVTDKTTKLETKKYTTKKTTLTNVVDHKQKQRFPETISPKKTVSTTITVTPKLGPSKPSKTVTTKTILTSRISKLAQPKQKPLKTRPSKIQNGHLSTEESDQESVVDSLDSITVEEISTKKTTQNKTNKVLRTTSDQVVKTHKSPTRSFSKPELIETKPSRKPEKKCITTKSIIINNKNSQEREVIIDLLRSKSSREPTPDRVCPLPVSSDDEYGVPRYPDEVTEPEDGSLTRKPKKLSDIPIMESEDNYEFTRITDITDNKKITEVDRVEETDDSLLTVNKKINKFLNTAEKLTKQPLKPKAPAPKVDRPTLIVDEDLKSDECLLSVSDKVSKFITTAEQLITPQPTNDRPKSPICKNYTDLDEDLSNVQVSKKVSHFTTTIKDSVTSKKSPLGPAPKKERPDLSDLDETIKDDECLLSVSDKVTKFITTADKLTSSDIKKPLTTPENKPRTPSERKSPTRTSPTRFSSSPTKEEPECYIIETEEETYLRRSSPTRQSPDKYISRKTTPEYSTSRRSDSLPRNNEKTPARRPSNQYSSINKTEICEKTTRRSSSPKTQDTTPKSTRRPSEEEPKSVLSTTSRFRSTESVKKAKALFENINKEQETLIQRNILSRPSVFEGRKPKSPQSPTRDTAKLCKRLSFSDEEETTTSTLQRRTTQNTHKDDTLKSTKLVIDKMLNRSKSPEKVPQIVTTKTYDRSDRESSPEGDLPHYMRPLDRTLRPNSPHRDNLNQIKKSSPVPEPVEDTRTTKFGVTLKRTDSGRTTSTGTTTERRKSSITLEKRITEEEIEEIFELDILEELLEKVVGYDLRKKIRTQIRLVKKLIEENRLSIYVEQRLRSSPKRESSPTKFKPFKPDELHTSESRVTEYETEFSRKSSPQRKIVDNKLYRHTDITNKKDDTRRKSEYETEYIRKSSPDRKLVDNKLYKHSDITTRKDNTNRTTEYQTSYTYEERRSSSDYTTTSTRRSQSPQTKLCRGKSPEKITPKRKSPERKNTSKPEPKTFTQLKKISPVSKTVTDDKPEWARQRNLRKVTETTNTPIRKSTTTTTTTKTTKVGTTRSSPGKEVKPTDIITSSYGVGPTDENGAPLFGLRALRAQNKTDTTKVQGTVIRSEYYAENGGEPVGQISVTKYSNDPKDLGSDEDLRTNKGLTSVTTTQKFGYKDTPSLRTLTDKKKSITNTEDSTVTTTKTSKVTRRGSVKALSQKFIDNTVETLKSERQSSYPKAGLILRTSSFKDNSGTDDSRETSPVEENTVTVKTSRTKTVDGGSFLTNRTKVTSGQDVINRMRTEEYEEGDTEEDIKARGLLNKFIGSQVILSALESQTSSKTSKVSPTSTVRRSTKITTTITEGGKPVTKTRVFQRPVTEEEIETVWDEETLQLLLQQSTDYEERRIVRARLRQVMAEHEACADLVEKTSREQSSGALEEKVETTTKKTFSSGPVTTTQVTTRVTTQQTSKKPVSPFAKFRQLDKQNSLNSPSTPKTPSGSGPLFKFTDPALSQSASTIKDRLLYWCKQKTKEYENIQLDNFSTSWADGLAFCALIHHFLPDAFDYSALSPKNRRHNFTLAFRVADEKADIAPLLDVDDMVACRKPDWKCVFTYVQSIYRRFKDED